MTIAKATRTPPPTNRLLALTCAAAVFIGMARPAAAAVLFQQNFDSFPIGQRPVPGNDLPGWNSMTTQEGLVASIVDVGGTGRAYRLDAYGGGASGWSMQGTAVLPAAAPDWTYQGTVKFVSSHGAENGVPIPWKGSGGLLLSSAPRGCYRNLEEPDGGNWLALVLVRVETYDGTGKAWVRPMLEWRRNGEYASTFLGADWFRDFPGDPPVRARVSRTDTHTLEFLVQTPHDGDLSGRETCDAALLDSLRYVGVQNYLSVYQYDDLELASSARPGDVRGGFCRLFDFETEAEARNWHDENGTANLHFPVSRAARFATSGTHSLCLSTPERQYGMPAEPSAERKPGTTDWSGYDRLVFDVANPTPFDRWISLCISDESHYTKDGFGYEMKLPPMSYLAAEVKTEALKAKGLDPGRIRVLQWKDLRPPHRAELCVDRVMLLKQGEDRPELPASYLGEFRALHGGNVASMRGRIETARKDLAAVVTLSPDVVPWAGRMLDCLEKEVNAYAADVEAGGAKGLQLGEQPAQLEAKVARAQSLVKLGTGFARVQGSVRAKGAKRQDVAVGFATSMQKVLPRAGAPQLDVSRQSSIALARNETEALQVIVLPYQEPLKAVSVRVGDLKGRGRAVLSAKAIASSVVGYVATDHVPPNGSPHVGWWPDPILGFMHETDIAAGDAQGFWVSVHAAKDQKAGIYKGKLEVLESGRPLYAFDLSVEVYPFTMPARSPLNLAVTWVPYFHEPDGKGGWREGYYRDESWRKRKLEWADFLADHYLQYDNLYLTRTSPLRPDFDVIAHLHQQERLGRFNLGHWDPIRRQGDGTGTRDELEAWKADIRQRIGPAYQKAKELGILDHAYIYGADELPVTWATGIEQAAGFIKKEFPGPLMLTTGYDSSAGTDGRIRSIDAFCPQVAFYNPQTVEKARAAGKQVWWYFCCWPWHTWGNLFIESPAITGRLLMGAQTAKYRPDGFLYHGTAVWNGPPITTGPFTDWNPRSFSVFDGDGSWTCPGPDFTPLTTIRLENFRDGVEDYAYALLLEQAVRQVEVSADRAARAEWLAEAKRLLAVPDTVVRTTWEYTEDPAEVYRWRRGMAEAIIRSGVEVALEEK